MRRKARDGSRTEVRRRAVKGRVAHKAAFQSCVSYQGGGAWRCVAIAYLYNHVIGGECAGTGTMYDMKNITRVYQLVR